MHVRMWKNCNKCNSKLRYYSKTSSNVHSKRYGSGTVTWAWSSYEVFHFRQIKVELPPWWMGGTWWGLGVVGLCSGKREPPEPAPPNNGCCFISWSLLVTRLSLDIALWMPSELQVGGHVTVREDAIGWLLHDVMQVYSRHQYLQPLKPWTRDMDLLANTTASSTVITPAKQSPQITNS